MRKVGKSLLILMEKPGSDEEIHREVTGVLERAENLMITSGIISYDKEVEVCGKSIPMELSRIKLMFEPQEALMHPQQTF